jgi:hypothetical protein
LNAGECSLLSSFRDVFGENVARCVQTNTRAKRPAKPRTLNDNISTTMLLKFLSFPVNSEMIGVCPRQCVC